MPLPSFRFALGQCTTRVPSLARQPHLRRGELHAVGDGARGPRNPQRRSTSRRPAPSASRTASRSPGCSEAWVWSSAPLSLGALDRAADQLLARRQDEARNVGVVDAPRGVTRPSASPGAPRRARPSAVGSAQAPGHAGSPNPSGSCRRLRGCPERTQASNTASWWCTRPEIENGGGAGEQHFRQAELGTGADAGRVVGGLERPDASRSQSSSGRSSAMPRISTWHRCTWAMTSPGNTMPIARVDHARAAEAPRATDGGDATVLEQHVTREDAIGGVAGDDACRPGSAWVGSSCSFAEDERAPAGALRAWSPFEPRESQRPTIGAGAELQDAPDGTFRTASSACRASVKTATADICGSPAATIAPIALRSAQTVAPKLAFSTLQPDVDAGRSRSAPQRRRGSRSTARRHAGLHGRAADASSSRAGRSCARPTS